MPPNRPSEKTSRPSGAPFLCSPSLSFVRDTLLSTSLISKSLLRAPCIPISRGGKLRGKREPRPRRWRQQLLKSKELNCQVKCSPVGKSPFVPRNSPYLAPTVLSHSLSISLLAAAAAAATSREGTEHEKPRVVYSSSCATSSAADFSAIWLFLSPSLPYLSNAEAKALTPQHARDLASSYDSRDTRAGDAIQLCANPG